MNPLNHFKEKRHPYIVIAIMLIVIFGVYVWSDSGVVTVAALEETQVAQVTYTPLAPLPGQNVASGDIFGYLQNLIFLGIGIAIVLAVLVIVVGGIQYMASDVFTKKEDAKTRMTMALAGLIIAFGGYLLLKTINPELVVFKFSPGATNIISKEGEIRGVQKEIEKTIERDVSGGRVQEPSGVSLTAIKIFSQDSTEFNEGKLFELRMGILTMDKNATVIAAERKCQTDGGKDFHLISTSVGVFNSGTLLTCQKK